MFYLQVFAFAATHSPRKGEGGGRGGGGGGGGGDEPTFLYQLVTLSTEAGIACSLNEPSGIPALTEVVGHLNGEAHYWMLNDNPESPVVGEWQLTEHADANPGSETLAVDITDEGVILGVGDVADARTPLLWLTAIRQPVALPLPANLGDVIITPVVVTDSGIVIGETRSLDDNVDANRTIVWQWHWEWVSTGDGDEVKCVVVSQPTVIDLALSFEREVEVNEQGWTVRDGRICVRRVTLNPSPTCRVTVSEFASSTASPACFKLALFSPLRGSRVVLAFIEGGHTREPE